MLPEILSRTLELRFMTNILHETWLHVLCSYNYIGKLSFLLYRVFLGVCNPFVHGYMLSGHCLHHRC